MFCMSETEKLEQIGRLAEEYSKLKGELNHVTEKCTKAAQAYSFAAQQFQTFVAVGDKVMSRSQPGTQLAVLDSLLNQHQLVEVLNERERLTKEVKETGDRLRALAPHLL